MQKDCSHKLARRNRPLTFINSSTPSSHNPVKGVHLALIRSHTAVWQQRKHRSHIERQGTLAWRKNVTPVVADGPRESQVKQESGRQLKVREHQYCSDDETLTDSIQVNEARLTCRRCLARRLAKSAVENQTASDTESCSHCQFYQGFLHANHENSIRLSTDSHRNDPFDVLPVPGSNEVYSFLDYCKTSMDCCHWPHSY
jgi:hypothetical protein